MIECKNVSIGFQDNILLQGFDLVVEEREKVVLDWPSGKGKSSLVKAILGLVKPLEGEILFNGETVAPSTISKVRQSISYVSQDVDLPEMSIMDFIKEVYGYKANRHLEYREEKWVETLQRFGLPQKVLHQKTMDLSGGERQRFGLVLAEMLERKVWILDEVVSGLDEKRKEDAVDFILSKEDTTMILISHDPIWNDKKVRKVDYQ
ncbi:MAG TPA: hypothetical protein DHN33_11745 [Eubacteriaceae bacterium]|nr:hypothetical protein [Eubacteriaceae bacterium]